MPHGAFVTPLAGASIFQVWQPAPGVVAGSAAADAAAPFALGTVGIITPKSTPTANSRTLAKFCRCSAIIAIAGTSGIGADGVATGAGVFTNDTGVALAIGDYVWLTAGLTPALAADEPAADSPSTLAADEAAADDYGKKRSKAYA